MIISPSKRVFETAQGIISNMKPSIKWSLTTNHLISKQNWGNVTIHNREEIEKERYEIGVLRYQFPGGESGEEMIFRFDTFAQRLKKQIENEPTSNILIVMHGFGLRVLLKSLLGWTEEYFESLAHPKHCELKRLAYSDGEFSLLDKMSIIDPLLRQNFIRRK